MRERVAGQEAVGCRSCGRCRRRRSFGRRHQQHHDERRRHACPHDRGGLRACSRHASSAVCGARPGEPYREGSPVPSMVQLWWYGVLGVGRLRRGVGLDSARHALCAERAAGLRGTLRRVRWSVWDRAATEPNAWPGMVFVQLYGFPAGAPAVAASAAVRGPKCIEIEAIEPVRRIPKTRRIQRIPQIESLLRQLLRDDPPDDRSATTTTSRPGTTTAPPTPP